MAAISVAAPVGLAPDSVPVALPAPDLPLARRQQPRQGRDQRDDENRHERKGDHTHIHPVQPPAAGLAQDQHRRALVDPVPVEEQPDEQDDAPARRDPVGEIAGPAE